MSKLSKKPYKGTRDFFPPLKRIQDYLFGKMKDVAHSYGYEAYDGPLLEEVDLYRAKSGEELINDQIYSFNDRGNREVAIRPEMTPTVARMVAQVHREVPKPIRWYSIPNLMRYERPQRGRLREHWQFNVDIFGGNPDLDSLEILSIAKDLLNSFGATQEHFEILVNHREFVEYLFKNKMKLNDEVTLKLFKLIDKSLKIGEEKFGQELAGLSIGEENEKLFREYLKIGSFETLEKFAKKISFPEETWSIGSFVSNLKMFNLENYISYAPHIIRGLDYYTGVVFEIFDKHPDNRRALSGGGAYANLLKIFNEDPLPGVGFGLGDVTLKDFLESHSLLPNLEKPKNDVYLCSQVDTGVKEIISLATQLRSEGLKVVTSLDVLKFKKAFQLAEKSGSKFIGLLGENELNEGKIQLKELSSRDQSDFKLNDINGLKNKISP